MTQSAARPSAVIVLAAGQGTRMKSTTPKIMHAIGGRSLVGHALAAAWSLAPEHLVAVVRHERARVAEHLETVAAQLGIDALAIADQDDVPGTGRAVELGLSALPADLEGTVVVTYGDVPLLTTETINGLVEVHDREVGRLGDLPLGRAEQLIGEALAGDEGNAGNVVDRLLGIEFGALPADLVEDVDQKIGRAHV